MRVVSTQWIDEALALQGDGHYGDTIARLASTALEVIGGRLPDQLTVNDASMLERLKTKIVEAMAAEADVLALYVEWRDAGGGGGWPPEKEETNV